MSFEGRSPGEGRVGTVEPLSVAPRLGAVSAFDGMRGAGVIIVILVHALPYKLESFSWVLDMFFVLSSFLITTLMIEESQRSGGVALRRFYAKRAWRLLPALYGALAIATIGAAIIFATASGDLEGFTFWGFFSREIIPAGVYVYNIVNPLGYPNDGVALYQMWSLSLEQQFYVVGGLFTAFLVIRRKLLPGAVICTVVALAIATARGTGHLGPINFWLQRPDALLIGIVAAVINSRIPHPLPAAWHRLIRIGGWLGVVTIAVVSLASIKWLEPTGFYVPFLPEIPEGLSDAQILDLVRSEVTTNNYWIRWGFTIVGWAMLPVTLAAARLPSWGVGRLLSIKPLVWVGGMSYSLYLIHTIPLLIFVGPLPANNVPARVVAALVTSFLFALPLYHWVEKPSMRRKVRVGSPQPQPEGAAP